MPRVLSLASVVGLQAIGSVSAFASTLLIARQRGAEIQGGFGLLKAEVDLLAALLLIGMPQAIFYFLNRGALTWDFVRRLTVFHALAAAVAVLVFGAAGRGAAAESRGILGMLAIATAVAALVAHSNLRGATLQTRSAAVFSAVTALPGLFLLLIVAATLAAGGMTDRGEAAVGPVFAVAYLIACLCTIAVTAHTRSDRPATTPAPGIVVLGRYGLSTWIPAVAQNLSPLIALTWIDHRIGDPVGVGVFSAALLSLNLVLTPFAMLVPLLFKRWMSVDAGGRRDELRRLLLPSAGVCTAVVVLVWVVQEPLVSAMFGSEYMTRGGLFVLLSMSLWPQAASRLFSVLFSADGRPWLAVVGEVARVATLAGGLYLCQVNQLVTLACLWVVAEFVSPAVGWQLSRQLARRAGRPQS